jgi:hypothetical protein
VWKLKQVEPVGVKFKKTKNIPQKAYYPMEKDIATAGCYGTGIHIL